MELFKRDTLTLAERLNREFADLDLAERLDRIGGLAYRAVFISNLDKADQVLSRAIALSTQSIKVATLKTSRMFPENKSLLQITRDRYGMEIEEFEPDSEALAHYLAHCGLESFYNSGEARRAASKDGNWTPLDEALKGADVWITARRSGAETPDFAEWDQERGLLVINPLADWTERQIEQTVAAHEIPVNPTWTEPSGTEKSTRAGGKPGLIELSRTSPAAAKLQLGKKILFIC